ncbi:MAG: hypothetical protein AB7V39_15030, partial [Nitrospiraceae bacterium]
KPPKTDTYILRHGNHDGFDEEGERKIYSAGDKVSLTEAQAKAFGDKFVSQRVYNAELKHMAELAKAGDAGNAPPANTVESNEQDPRGSPTPNQAGNTALNVAPNPNSPPAGTTATVDQPVGSPKPGPDDGKKK